MYIHFESDRSVKSLLLACTHDFSNGDEYYYKISSKRMRSKEVGFSPLNSYKLKPLYSVCLNHCTSVQTSLKEVEVSDVAVFKSILYSWNVLGGIVGKHCPRSDLGG